MLSVSDAARFSEENNSIKTFKPWWEILIDYLVFALLLFTLLSWTNVIGLDSHGLSCLPSNSNVTYSFNFVRYFNARCAQHFQGRLLLYYPYLIFFQCLTLFLLQHAWLKVPAVTTKFDSYHDIFNDMYDIRRKFRRDPYNLQMLPEFVYDHKQMRHIQILHDKLMLLLTDKTYLIIVYTAKLSASLILSISFTCILIYWLSVIDFYKIDFQCILKNQIPDPNLSLLACNFSPAYFLYGIILSNLALLTLMIVVEIYGFCWLFWQRNFVDKKDIFGNMTDYYAGLPGYKDLQYCMALIKGNIKDGNMMQEVIKACLKGKTSHQETLVNNSTSQDKRLFIEEYNIVKYITAQLGLEAIKNDQSSTHFFQCLEYVKTITLGYNLDVVKTMEDEIVEEIEKNMLQFKSIINSDSEFLDYQTILQSLDDRATQGYQYAFLAAANILNIRIVIIHCNLSGGFKEVFEPIETIASFIQLKTFFMTFVGPHYYHVTRALTNSNDVAEKRKRYGTDERYRHLIRQSGVRQFVQNETVVTKFQRKRKRISVTEVSSNLDLRINNKRLGEALLGRMNFSYVDLDGSFADKPRNMHINDLPNYCNTSKKNKAVTKYEKK